MKIISSKGDFIGTCTITYNENHRTAEIGLMLGDKDFLSTLEHLFLPQAIGRDEDHMARLVPGLGLEQQPQNAHHTEDDAETRIEIGLESRWENGIHDGPKPAHTANSGQLALSEGSTRT